MIHDSVKENYPINSPHFFSFCFIFKMSDWPINFVNNWTVILYPWLLASNNIVMCWRGNKYFHSLVCWINVIVHFTGYCSEKIKKYFDDSARSRVTEARKLLIKLRLNIFIFSLRGIYDRITNCYYDIDVWNMLLYILECWGK